MKNTFFSFLIIAIFISSCKEELPMRSTTVALLDTTFVTTNPSSAQQKVVLFEEYTGTSCINCPKGHNEIKALLANFGTKLAVVGNNSGALAEPVKQTDVDLRCQDAEQIASSFEVNSRPMAIIDRAKVGGEYKLGIPAWRDAVTSAMSKSVNVNLTDSIYFSADRNKYIYQIRIEMLENITNDLNLTIFLLENKIDATQKSLNGELEPYEQEHVMRKTFTAALGNRLVKPSGSSQYEKGRTYLKQIELEMNSKWKLENCYIITSVSEETSTSRTVLQSCQRNIK